jgi:hypothetical protein
MMDNIQKRFFLFLCGCILIRTLFVLIAKYYVEYLPIMGCIALVPTIGFLYFWISGSRQTGREVFGDKIWWNDLRPIHAILYGSFAYMAITQNVNAWIPLLIDVSIGLIAFLVFHSNKNEI